MGHRFAAREQSGRSSFCGWPAARQVKAQRKAQAIRLRRKKLESTGVVRESGHAIFVGGRHYETLVRIRASRHVLNDGLAVVQVQIPAPLRARGDYYQFVVVVRSAHRRVCSAT